MAMFGGMFGSTWQSAKEESDEQKKKKSGTASVGDAIANVVTSATNLASNVVNSVGSKGGKSNKTTNSQYTTPTLGNSWDANTDYQAIINNAVASGDYVTAAKAEQLRNQKITATGGHYSPTNLYSGWLDNTDYSTIGKNQMANGASWEDVLDTYNKRYNKANGTVGLQQYANDELQNMMLQYINQQKAIEGYQNMIDEYEQENPKEEYNSKYDPQIDAILNEILNRDDFSYNVENDPLYQQYVQMYRREGDRAMRETMAEAAAGAGGMNTYAITAAQQANNYYNSQLNDKIPELYQLAYEMYLNDKESMVQDLGILQNMDATQYARYRDTINDLYNDRNFAYGAFQDAVAQGNLQTNFDYNAMLDNRDFEYNDMWKNKEWEANKEEIEYSRNQYNQETAKEEVWKLLSLGITPSAELIARSGMSEADINLVIAAMQMEQAGSSKTSNVSQNTQKAVKKGEDEGNESDYSQWAGSNNYTAIDNACRELTTTKGKSYALEYLREAREMGAIDTTSYMVLVNKYRE